MTHSEFGRRSDRHTGMYSSLLALFHTSNQIPVCKFNKIPDLNACFNATRAILDSDGRILIQIGLLTSLTHLSISNSSGKLTSTKGCLTKLTALILYLNQFSGILPSSNGLLTELPYLSFFSYQLTCTI
jgi:hypothetical protein